MFPQTSVVACLKPHRPYGVEEITTALRGPAAGLQAASFPTAISGAARVRPAGVYEGRPFFAIGIPALEGGTSAIAIGVRVLGSVGLEGAVVVGASGREEN